MSGYTKLFSSIVGSTIWSEDDHTRLVWITMLALANWHGEVEASVPGLAKLASVPLESVEQALRKLSQPDPYSRTKDHDGRRIEEIDGGWLILNHAKYRERASREDKREQGRVRQARFKQRRSANAQVTQGSAHVTPNNKTSAHTDTDTDKEKRRFAQGDAFKDTPKPSLKKQWAEELLKGEGN
jgi:hypothetical protein